MGQPEAEIAVICQEDQPLALQVEPAHRHQVVPLSGEQFADGVPLLRITAGAEVAGGLVERDIYLPPGSHFLAIHHDPVVDGIHFGAELPDGFAVHGHTALQNHLLAGAAGGHARISQEFLQTNHRNCGMQNADCGLQNEKAAQISTCPRSPICNPQSTICNWIRPWAWSCADR